MDEAGEVDDILNAQGSIKAPPFPKRADQLRILSGPVPEIDQHQVGGKKMRDQEGDQRDSNQRRHADDEPTEQVAQHPDGRCRPPARTSRTSPVTSGAAARTRGRTTGDTGNSQDLPGLLSGSLAGQETRKDCREQPGAHCTARTVTLSAERCPSCEPLLRVAAHQETPSAGGG